MSGIAGARDGPKPHHTQAIVSQQEHKPRYTQFSPDLKPERVALLSFRPAVLRRNDGEIRWTISQNRLAEHGVKAVLHEFEPAFRRFVALFWVHEDGAEPFSDLRTGQAQR